MIIHYSDEIAALLHPDDSAMNTHTQQPFGKSSDLARNFESGRHSMKTGKPCPATSFSNRQTHRAEIPAIECPKHLKQRSKLMATQNQTKLFMRLEWGSIFKSSRIYHNLAFSGRSSPYFPVTQSRTYCHQLWILPVMQYLTFSEKSCLFQRLEPYSNSMYFVSLLTFFLILHCTVPGSLMTKTWMGISKGLMEILSYHRNPNAERFYLDRTIHQLSSSRKIDVRISGDISCPTTNPIIDGFWLSPNLALPGMPHLIESDRGRKWEWAWGCEKGEWRIGFYLPIWMQNAHEPHNW